MKSYGKKKEDKTKGLRLTFLCGHRVIPCFRHIFFTTVGHNCSFLAASSIGRWKYFLKSFSVDFPALSLCINPQPLKNYSISTNKQYKVLIVSIYLMQCECKMPLLRVKIITRTCSARLLRVGFSVSISPSA